MTPTGPEPDDTLPRPALVCVWVGVCGALAVGMLLPDLMGGDAAQDAVMAMRMYREGDWLHLLRDGQPYLDKPHLLFWTAVASYHLFGVHAWAYRLPSVLVTLLGAWSTGRLAARLAGRRAGQLAALVFATAQAVLLSAHDVRMDALLTGFTALALWQLTAWLEEGRARSALVGGAALGLAVASKGMIGPALAVPALLLFAWGRGLLRRLLDPRLLLALLAFALALAPVLHAYYVQFDLHPELVVDGRAGRSGVAFILLGQSVERFTGGDGNASGNDYAFFFHTLLWAVLPWTALLLDAWWARLRGLAHRGAAVAPGPAGGLAPPRELLTFPWPLAFIALLNLSRFKLPHYLNVTFPLLAAGVALHLEALWREGSRRRLAVLAGVQAGVIGLLLVGSAALHGWAFPLRQAWVAAVGLLLLAALATGFRARGALARIAFPSALAAVLVNFLLSASFFPQLDAYHPGSAFVQRGTAAGADWARTFELYENYQPVRIHAGEPVPSVDLAGVRRELASGAPLFLVVGTIGKRELGRAGIGYRALASSPACRITRLTPQLLSPARRGADCPRLDLVQLAPDPRASADGGAPDPATERRGAHAGR